MTQHLKILNSKEVKNIYELLAQQYGFSGKLEVAFMLSEKKERVYIFTKDLANIDLGALRVDTMGLYFATFFEGKLRLTIEGTQLIGPQCTRNVIDVSKKEMQTWMLGEKLELSKLEQHPGDVDGFVILRYGTDYLGCGKIGGDLVLNYIPKTRYIHALYDDVIVDENGVKE
jgi:NOL1/NOP2/fmu family ribosome biogenesis protein